METQPFSYKMHLIDKGRKEQKKMKKQLDFYEKYCKIVVDKNEIDKTDR